jgi:hypothetical protein
MSRTVHQPSEKFPCHEHYYYCRSETLLYDMVRKKHIASRNPYAKHTWLSCDCFDDPIEAAQSLALPHAPHYRIGPIPFDKISGGYAIEPRWTAPAFGQPGGAIEVAISFPLEVDPEWIVYDFTSKTHTPLKVYEPNPEHLDILKQGVDVWNEWRSVHHGMLPDLRCASLESIPLQRANLTQANLSGAGLHGVDLRGADLTRAILRCSDLTAAFIIEAHLGEADFTSAGVGKTLFIDTDLSNVKGLETVIHSGPSTIGIDTLYRSGGNIPEAFLRGCGVPDPFIEYLPSHIGAQAVIQYSSCFISYSTEDEEFAKRLHSRMRDEHLRVWFAPEDMKGGAKIHEQIERAIQYHDRLLLVLSEHSIHSEWVTTELYNARQVELRENRRKLFPIRLVDTETLKTWKCFDADTGKDLAREVREYFIPDFSNWKNQDAFEIAFGRLLRDLRATERTKYISR